jgi:hypothetical protein
MGWSIMTDKTAARVKKVMAMVKARRAAGEDIPVVARTAELDLAITDMGCDPNDPAQFLALSVVLLNAHFKPHYTPDWIEKVPPKWTVRLDALLVLDLMEEHKRNSKLGMPSLCKALLTRGRKRGEGLWRGMYGTGAENLRKRARIALKNPAVIAYIEAEPQRLLDAYQRSIEMMKSWRDREVEPSPRNEDKGQLPKPRVKASTPAATPKRKAKPRAGL